METMEKNKLPDTFTGLVNMKNEFKGKYSLVELFSVYCTEAQSNRFRKLKNKEFKFHSFEHEGRIYKGNLDTAIIQFIMNNPNPEDFSVWLQNNYKELNVL